MLKKMKTGSTIKYPVTVILSICAFVFLCGLDWFIYKAELKNADEPFVELSGSIGDSIGNAQNKEQQELNAKVTDSPQKPAAGSSNKKFRSNVIEISIEGEKIKIDGDYRSISDIKLMTMDIGSATQNNSGTQLDGKKIVLEDNWADYTVYKNVKDIFESAGVKIEEKIKDE